MLLNDKTLWGHILFLQRTTGKLKGTIALAAMKMVVMLPARALVERTERRMSFRSGYLVTWLLRNLCSMEKREVNSEWQLWHNHTQALLGNFRDALARMLVNVFMDKIIYPIHLLLLGIWAAEVPRLSKHINKLNFHENCPLEVENSTVYLATISVLPIASLQRDPGSNFDIHFFHPTLHGSFYADGFA